ncbi:MAG: peptide chain release factor N(5)-glutamine methyltransferase [Phycicoccus sp.]|nr:peptide chain release factor N(5)-glutamine methyltransferase [Phycicoccus sp.]
MSRTLDAEVRAARESLSQSGIAAAEADAVELAAFTLGVDASEVRRRMVLRDRVDDGFLERYAGLIAERSSRIPLQHLTGRAYFRHLTLAVGPGVFVPRPETETVAGWAIEALRQIASEVSAPRAVDLCTGSGAIALSLKDEVPAALVHAVEVDESAHAWAAHNVAALGLDIDLRLGDATQSFPDLAGSVDVVVSNPPYIPSGMEPIDPEVREHDPVIALYGGSADGLAIPRLVAARAATLLRPGGVLVMEHADTQGESLPAALRGTGWWDDVEDRDDLSGRPRATIAVRAT